MTPSNVPHDCSDPACPCHTGIPRRAFLKLGALGALAAGIADLPLMAGPFDSPAFSSLVPEDKKLTPEFLASLTARGQREVYSGAALEKIGLPIGGICAGQLYLGGDGKLWHWDIFNQHIGTGDGHYAHPMTPSSPLEQGFAIRVGGVTRRLDASGFADVSFTGEYPIGFVRYADPGCPVEVALRAFSPFVPLNAQDSSLPATIMEFTITNRSPGVASGTIAGWLQNAVCLYSGREVPGKRLNRERPSPKATIIEMLAEGPAPQQQARPPIVFEDFEGADYGKWRVEGQAFGQAPSKGSVGVQTLSGFAGKGTVNSYANSDQPRGTLTSPPFPIERAFINFLIGGGNHPRETCINLLVDGKIVRSATGKNTDAMDWTGWNVKDLEGKTGTIQIVDNHSGGWGHIDIDRIEFADAPRGVALEKRGDFGSMAFALLESRTGDALDLEVGSGFPEAAFGEPSPPVRRLDQPLHASLSRPFRLEAGQSMTATFVIAWHFPNLRVPAVPGEPGRHYARRFESAGAVAEYIAEHYPQLDAQTKLWHQTWYDSTLPFWFLNRTFLNASILATSTCYWFANGRFYGWEGVGCCQGTCTHVWHYAHAVARLFPELERSAREMQDYGTGFDDRTGLIRFRAETAGDTYAADGQAGCILRTWREHQMARDASFLQRVWPRAKKAMEYLINQDGDNNGILEGSQHNTLDTAYFGPNAMCSGLYDAALRAAEAMAREMGDAPFADRCRSLSDAGARRIVENLFNGEYFIHKPDPKHPEAMKSGNGCLIDQVFGQSWMWQVGLGRLLPRDKTLSALRSLWKYNFTPDVGPYRAVHKGGRWYAMPGEAGLLMCTWPKGVDTDPAGKANPYFVSYFNECMNGFEYQVAWHMIAEGMLTEGLSVARAIHDRYHPLKRNPYNEVECGDHYARSMASYGLFTAICGYEHHGPNGHLGFAPRLSPENFRAAFTAASAWGTFTQLRKENVQTNTLTPRYGQLKLHTFAVEVPNAPRSVAVTMGGAGVDAKHAYDAGRLTLTFANAVVVPENATLSLIITQ